MRNNKNYPLYDVPCFHTINEVIENSAKEYADKPALMYNSKALNINITYSKLKEYVLKIISIIEDLSKEHIHVACIGPNSCNWLLTYLSVLSSKNVFVPIDKDLPVDDIVGIIKHSESKIVFCGKKQEKIFKENIEKFDDVKYFICFECSGENDRFLSFDRLLNEKKDYDKQLIKEKDLHCLKLLVYTSGTTGTPKGVMLTEGNIIACAYNGQKVSRIYSRCLSVLPYHHTYEAVAGIIVGIYHGATICVNDSLKKVLPNLTLYKPDYIYLVPAFVEVFYKKIQTTIKSNGKEKQFNILVKVSNALLSVGIDLRKKLFSSIHKAFGGNLIKIVCGGAPLRPEIGKFFDDIGIDVINGYGITECSPLVCVNRDKFNDPSTVGCVLPGVEIKLDNYLNEREGEICVKGEIVMLGYYKNPEQTAEVLKDGWFYTGDYGYINEKNQLLITGRKKNLIVLANGKNIYPEEIENYIQNIEEVKEVIVYSPKSENNEEKGLYAQIYIDEAYSVTEDEIKEKVRQALSVLPVYKQIQKIIIRDKEFIKTTSNKIKRDKIDQ